MCFCIKHCVSPQVAHGLMWLEFKVCVAEWQDVRVQNLCIFLKCVHKITCNSLNDMYIHTFIDDGPWLRKNDSVRGDSKPFFLEYFKC